VFEDFMFRYLLREAGRLHLAVQIHTAVGTGDFFSITGGNVLNLENVLRDPRYSNVNFVLLHGGYPFQEQAIWLTARENVYLDSSLMGVYSVSQGSGRGAAPLAAALSGQGGLWLGCFPVQ
jgi:predicted TIM-barrel fold metal-dependent hydrolase